MTSATDTGTAPGGSRWTLPVLLMIVLLNQIGFGVVFPLQPFYAKVFNAPAWQITLMFATFSLGQFLGELTWGRLSDRIGRRIVLLITISMTAVGFVAFAYAPTMWIAILVRGVAGVFAGNMSVIQAYVVDASPRDRLGPRIGFIGMAFAVGIVLGPTLGGFLTRPELGAAGFHPPLLTAGVGSGLAALGVFLFVREVRTFDGKAHHAAPSLVASITGAFDDVPTRCMLLCTLFSFTAISSMWSTSGLWGEVIFGWGPREVGLILALAGLFGAVSQGVSGPAVRRLGDIRVIVWGLAVASAFMLALALSRETLWAAAAMSVNSLGHAISQPSVASVLSRITRPENQGSVLGANSALAALGRTVGPLMAGFLYSGVGPLAPIFFGMAVMIPASWLAYRAGQALQAQKA